MMLSRTGRHRDPPCRSKARSMRAGRHHGVVWRVHPTAGPHLLLLLLLMCVCVCVCVCWCVCVCVQKALSLHDIMASSMF